MKLRLFIISCVLWLAPLFMQAATLSPALLDLSGDRGELVTSAFTVINTGEKDQTYYLGTLSFAAKDDSGEPVFLSENKKDGMVTWIEFSSDRVIVPARSKAEVPFKIQIPSDVAPGTTQAAITVSGAPSEVVAANGAVIEAKTAILVFLTINGTAEKKAALLDFKHVGNWIETELQPEFQFRIQNQGNVYAIPAGVIDMKDLFGRTLKTIKVNEDYNRILPMTTRTFENMTNQTKGFLPKMNAQFSSFAIGPVTAVLNVNLGDGFAPIHATTTFWYVPYHLMGFILLLLAIIFIGYAKLSKHKRK